MRAVFAAAAPARAQAPVTAVPVEGTGTTTAAGADTVIDDMQTLLGTVAITSAERTLTRRPSAPGATHASTARAETAADRRTAAYASKEHARSARRVAVGAPPALPRQHDDFG